MPPSPYAAKGLPISTPMTAAIEMYNWLHDIYNNWKSKNKVCFYFNENNKFVKGNK